MRLRHLMLATEVQMCEQVGFPQKILNILKTIDLKANTLKASTAFKTDLISPAAILRGSVIKGKHAALIKLILNHMHVSGRDSRPATMFSTLRFRTLVCVCVCVCVLGSVFPEALFFSVRTSQWKSSCDWQECFSNILLIDQHLVCFVSLIGWSSDSPPLCVFPLC